jgi:hypothetical protein
MPKCFVIGPHWEAGSPIRAAADDFMEYIVRSVVTSKELGYEAIRADGLNEPGRITSQIIKLLIDAELVVADLTTKNANVFYKLSLRHSIGKPVVHMAHEGAPPVIRCARQPDHLLYHARAQRGGRLGRTHDVSRATSR